MDNQTLQIKFKQRINKIDSQDYDNISCWQIVESFNKAQLDWCRRQLHGSNQFKEGDESSKRRIDDLQRLLVTNTLLPSNTTENYVEYAIPGPVENYFEYKRTTSYATKFEIDEYGKETDIPCCTEPRSMTVYLAEVANVDLIMRDPHKNPDFEWGETFCTMQGNTLRVYKKDFDITSTEFTYYRKPRYIQIEGCRDPYTHVTGANIECEFKDDVVELLIDEAVSILAGDITDVNQYQREGSAVEKNN